MSRLLLVTISLIFYADPSRSLPQSVIREFTGLDSKANHFVLPVNPINGTAASIPNPLANISKPCRYALIELSKSPLGLAAFADASGKPSSGFFAGNLVWLGSYSLCKNLTVYGAKYCLAPKVDVFFPGLPKPVPLEWGLCVPAVCTEQDIAFGFKEIIGVLGSVEKKYHIPEVFAPPGKDFTVACAHPSKWTNGPIITLVICIIIACLCLTGTMIDLCVVQGSWKFWVPSNEFQRERFPPAEETGLSNGSNGESSPLLRANGYVASSDSSGNVQIRQPSLEERGFLVKFLACFSIVRNTSKIMDCTVPPGAITSLNGVRVLSMWWVILGHTYLWLLIYRLINDLGLKMSLAHRFSFNAVNSAFFSVDSFFFLSGLLVAYLSFRRMDKNDGQLPLFQFYFHRFWRLTPSYMFVILFYSNLYAFLGEGPLWYGSQLRTPCDKYWWTNLLYINNFHPKSLINEVRHSLVIYYLATQAGLR